LSSPAKAGDPVITVALVYAPAFVITGCPASAGHDNGDTADIMIKDDQTKPSIATGGRCVSKGLLAVAIDGAKRST
jgi:hypothetical protein